MLQVGGLAGKFFLGIFDNAFDALSPNERVISPVYLLSKRT